MQLDVGKEFEDMMQNSGRFRATQIVAGFDHSCALLANTTIKCWGHNEHGQLGNGSNVNSITPVIVSEP